MFRNSEDVHILTVPRNPRRYLVLIRAGSNPRPSFFTGPLPETREYDVGLNYYASPHPDDAFRATADVIFAGGWSKFQGAKRFFEFTGLHEAYEGVFFLDDDVALLFNPDAFFACCRDHGLHLAQPALTADCTDAMGFTRQHPGLILRRTNWVEVMAPFMARDFLKEMLHSFDLSISGWGLDLYWGYHLGDRWAAGIIDDFLVRHTVPSNHDTGAFYQYLKTIGVSPWDEMKAILKNIGIDQYEAKPTGFVYRTYVFKA
jgi:hypothetical protein